MIDNSLPYWMALAHAKAFTTKRKMQFLIECVHEKRTLQDALMSIKSADKLGFTFTEKEWNGIKSAVDDLPNYSFLAEKIEAQGIHTVNVMDKNVYPESLKKNLKREAPLLIYCKGNMDLLKRESVAIVGSRNCSDVSLQFTDNIAKSVVHQNKVIASGFAKGIDRKALDSALKYYGQSIVVLPQGIETYKSKVYYQDIVKGNVLILSIYHPKASWSVGLAMDRNKVIYGLADEIYAAESSNKGGTWEGVLNGLKRGRKILVRVPDKSEKNANQILIEMGATPVDLSGNPFPQYLKDIVNEDIEVYHKKQETHLNEEEIIKQVILELNKNKGIGLTTKEIGDRLNLSSKIVKKLNMILKLSDEIIIEKKGRSNFYTLKGFISQQKNLFT